MQNEKILLDLGKKVRVTIASYLSLVLTPTAGYFIYFGGRIKSENLVFFLVTVVVSSLAVQIFFAPLRVKQFQKLQDLLDKINEGSSASEQNAKELKKRLISHPIEGSLYGVLGTVSALIVFSIVFSLSVETTPFFWFSAGGTFLFTSSYIFILVVMLTERLIGKYISIPQLANQKIGMKDVSFIGERGRKIWMIVSITSFPIISLGIIAAQAGMNLLSMSAIFTHFIVIFVFVLFYAAILIYESERNSIGTMVKVIEDLEAGNIAHENIPMTSSSEIGFLMQDIDSFHNRLYNIIKSILRATASVSSNSKQINNSANSISSAASEQAANVEQTSASLEGLNSVLQATKRKARGYKSEHFKTIAYLLTGKLNFQVVNKFVLPI